MNASNSGAPDRNLAMEFVRITESAALAAGQWVDRGQKEKGDGAVVDAMRQLINTVAVNGVVVIGEGEKDGTSMLFNGKEAGNGQGPAVDITVDSISGMTLMVRGCPNSIAVLAATDRDSMYDLSAVFYMDKIAVGPEATGRADIEAPVERNIKVVAKAKGLRPKNAIVVVLDRPHHADMIRDIREAGAKVRLIGDGNVAGAVAAAQNTNPIDIMTGVGSTPRGVITTRAMKCMGGETRDKLHPRDEAEIEKAPDAGHDLSRVPTTDDLVASDSYYFVATGVTNSDMLRGVAHRGSGTWTRPLVICSKSGTIRHIETFHFLKKLRRYASIDYGKDEMPDIDL